MGEAATLLSMAASRQSQDITGEVVLTATDLMAAAFLPVILSKLRSQAPGITICINESSGIQNLKLREADIAIRHARPDQSDLISTHVGDLRGNLYASTDYLTRAGQPRTKEDLADHDFVGIPDPDRLIAPLNNMGIPVQPSNFVMQPYSSLVTWEMVKSGHGISMLPEVLGDVETSVEKALADLPSLEFPIWLVTHRELQTSPRIRAVFDLLAHYLGKIANARIEETSSLSSLLSKEPH
ncbi:substrate-binding domain-containing protein [Aestuariibius sp. HNIBRBA575]|uniref:substrate-binding domain-containing protein n=1 Tax=Aestuariibius sp. HNIBRBA575 TaxID=3233343 RepID=UPI0034A1D6C4